MTPAWEYRKNKHMLRQPLHTRLNLITLRRKGIPKVALVHLAHFLFCPLHDNVLMNPLHPDMPQVALAQVEPYQFDARL
jgi:hypothetical protein